MKSDLENWIINDHNPLVIFNTNGDVVYTNNAGEYLLNFVSSKHIYKEIIKFAPTTPTFEHIRHKFEFERFSYEYALVGYDNYDEIGVMFYQNIKPLTSLNEDVDLLNVYFIFDLVKTYVFVDKDIKFVDIFDVDLPDIKFNKDRLIKLLTHLFEAVKDNDKIQTEIKLKIGEYIKINNKKYKILEFCLSAENIIKKEITTQAEDFVYQKKKVSLLIPFITD